MIKLLCIHGYNGDPYGKSYQHLKNACSDKYELHTIDYEAENPIDAIIEIRKYVRENKIDCIIGCSLGGFIAMAILGESRIVVNPCWNPAEELPKIGYTGDIKCYKEIIDRMMIGFDFEERNLCSGVFASNDELLGNKYIDEFDRYFNSHYLIEGSHQINAAMAKDIIEDILPKHIECVNDFCKKLKEIDNAPWL